ncbi:hypothetical protein GE061_014432 [Apolygus lucorum]|uniref:1-acyl-sn-glycerol-3-phosphate acyltransferase n=1 Tax=Apolygus lucorum TaxID=248454 RepID=A0A8S9XUN5_APOLU|nr:hypothetical protein GE061_014432 [Apolygus lucorum]
MKKFPASKGDSDECHKNTRFMGEGCERQTSKDSGTMWLWLLGLMLPAAIGISILLPRYTTKKVRYYACFTCYILNLTILSFAMMPYFFLRPKNLRNMKVYSKYGQIIAEFMGFNWLVRNKNILKKHKTAMILSNHQSSLDILGTMHVIALEETGLVVNVAKKELFHTPLGQALRMCGSIFIDRSNAESAMTTLQKSSRTLRQSKAKLWVFPEGTRNTSGGLLPFKRGAFICAIEAQVPIIPVVFSPYYFMDRSKKIFDTGTCIISVLEDIPTEGLQMRDLNNLMDRVYNLMSAEYEKLKEEVEREV